MGTSGYKPQASDTSVEVDRSLFDAYRLMTADEKLHRVSELSLFMWEVKRSGLRLRYPDASERELDLRLAVYRLGRDKVKELYGFDPAD